MKSSRVVSLSLSAAVAAAILGASVLPSAPRGGPAPRATGEQASGARPAGTTLADLPDEEGRSLGEAMHEARYAVWRVDGTPARGVVAAEETLTAGNPSQRYATAFADDGARVDASGGAWSVGLKLVAFGAESGTRPVGRPTRSARGRRVEYARDGIVEWYENTDKGLEHGFTIPAAPEGDGRIAIALEVDSSLKGRTGDDGSRVDFYSSPGVREVSYCKLVAFDATGRELAARMEAGGARLAIHVDARDAAYPVIVDPLVVTETKLSQDPVSFNDDLGCSVSVDGDTAVVGARSGDGAAPNSGAVYVFVRSGGAWTEAQKLSASDGAEYDEFGFSVCLSGDTAVIGAQVADIVSPNDSQGAAYVFVRSYGTWSEQQKLTASDGASGDYFGRSVSVDGDTAVVGSPVADVSGNTDQGAAYVFVRASGTWTVQDRLTASDGLAYDNLGHSVSVSGDTVVAGAYGVDFGTDLYQGAAYVFVRSGTTWDSGVKLVASDGAAGDQFGNAVCVDGDTAIVGAYQRDEAATNSGAAYVFTRSAGTWDSGEKLAASDGAASDAFGGSVSLSGDTAVVGAIWADVGGNSHQGAAYVFVWSGLAWTQEEKLTAGDGVLSDELGISVSVSGDTVIAGAENGGGVVAKSGAAYVFVRSGVTWTEEQELSISGGLAADYFGCSVSVDGDTAVIGAEAAHGIATNNEGAAYVFVRRGDAWVEEQRLAAGDGVSGDAFGCSVSLNGDTAVVGAKTADTSQGVAYAFVRSGGAWTEEAKLTAADGAAGDYFGVAVSVSGDTAVVGALWVDVGANTNQGAAYVFVRSGGAWPQQKKLTASDGAAEDRLGISVSVSGDTAVVGAADADSAYVFVRSGSAWTEEDKLTASAAEVGVQFGCAVSLSGDTAVVGARTAAIGGGTDQGAAYVFVRSGGVWDEEEELLAADGAAFDIFGTSVSVSGDTVVVGAHHADVVVTGNNRGAAYVFVRASGTWTEEEKLTASDGADLDEFGNAVSVSGDTVVVGSYFAEVGSHGNQGAVYVFDLSWKNVDSSGAASDCFGWAVSMSGDTAVVGAPGAGGVGAAYVFVKSGGIWKEEQKLTASDGIAGDFFGHSVFVDDDTAIVGAPVGDGIVADTGAAYVFVRSGSTWADEDKLFASDGAADDLFGQSVSLSGDTAVVGASQADAAQGVAWVFTRLGGVWDEEQKLTATDGVAGDEFGVSVSVSGETAFVGAHKFGSGQGAAYVFARSGVTWAEEDRLSAADGDVGDGFGVSISTSADTAVIGAGGDDLNRGAAYVFALSAGVWTEEQKLTAADGRDGDELGHSVSLSGDTAVLGAHGADMGVDADRGAAYVFVRSVGVWSEYRKLAAPDGAADDLFGCAASVSGELAVVGAYAADVGANADQGAAYFFQLDLPPIPPADGGPGVGGVADGGCAANGGGASALSLLLPLAMLAFIRRRRGAAGT